MENIFVLIKASWKYQESNGLCPLIILWALSIVCLQTESYKDTSLWHILIESIPKNHIELPTTDVPLQT